MLIKLDFQEEDNHEIFVTREMNAKAMILFRRHMSDSMKSEFVAVSSPKDLWDSLKDRFDHQKTIWLLEVHHNWLNLRFQDFKSVTEYNAEVCRIRALLQYCGEQLTDNDLLEKTYTTFPNSDNLLQKQYRQSKFTKFSEFITQLLLDEKNSLILMRDNNSRSTGAKAIPLPEANATRGPNPRYENRDKGQSSRQPRNDRKSRRTKRGLDSRPNRGPLDPRQPRQPLERNNNRASRPQTRDNASKPNLCYRCGGTEHWQRICSASAQQIQSYHHENKPEINMVKITLEVTPFEVVNFD